MKHPHRFGREVRKLRVNRGVSLRELAERAYLSHAYLSQVERGKLPPPGNDKVVAIAKALGHDRNELLALAGVEKHARNWIPWLQASILKLETCNKSGKEAVHRDTIFEESWHRVLQALSASLEPSSEMDKAMDTLQKEIEAGLRHGTFELSVTGEKNPDGNHRLVVRAGRIHEFTILQSEMSVDDHQ